jgi:hypothetical protein
MVQKDLTQLFTGIFFFVSLIYFTVMFLVLKDGKSSVSSLSESAGSRDKFGSSEIKEKTSLDYLF